MAKLSKTITAARVIQNAEVRRVRSRYQQALDAGHSTETAAKLAHGDDPISPPDAGTAGKDAPAPVKQPPEKEQKAPEQIVSISGGTGKISIEDAMHHPVKPPQEIGNVKQLVGASQLTVDDIPPNWQDLPWVELRTLAMQINGGAEIKSRKGAIEAIKHGLDAL
jgi:hypothetical protein